jgi:hypothetical protein
MTKVGCLPQKRRDNRDNLHTIMGRKAVKPFTLTTTIIVPCKQILLTKFNCHIHVEHLVQSCTSKNINISPKYMNYNFFALDKNVITSRMESPIILMQKYIGSQ